MESVGHDTAGCWVFGCGGCARCFLVSVSGIACLGEDPVWEGSVPDCFGYFMWACWNLLGLEGCVRGVSDISFRVCTDGSLVARFVGRILVELPEFNQPNQCRNQL